MNEDKKVTLVTELLPDMDEILAVNRVKEIAKWIEGLPTSGLPYVEIGFQALHQELIQKIVNH